MPSIEASKYILAKYKPELDRLYTEIRNVNPNVVVALGGTASWALLHDAGLRSSVARLYEGLPGTRSYPPITPQQSSESTSCALSSLRTLEKS
jgi:hypothetical protein